MIAVAVIRIHASRMAMPTLDVTGGMFPRSPQRPQQLRSAAEGRLPRMPLPAPMPYTDSGHLRRTMYQDVEELMCNKSLTFAGSILSSSSGEEGHGLKMTDCHAIEQGFGGFLIRMDVDLPNGVSCDRVTIGHRLDTPDSMEQMMLISKGSCEEPEEFGFLRSLHDNKPDEARHRLCNFITENVCKQLMTTAEGVAEDRHADYGFSEENNGLLALYNCTIDVDGQEMEFTLDLDLWDARRCRDLRVKASSSGANDADVGGGNDDDKDPQKQQPPSTSVRQAGGRSDKGKKERESVDVNVKITNEKDSCKRPLYGDHDDHDDDHDVRDYY